MKASTAFFFSASLFCSLSVIVAPNRDPAALCMFCLFAAFLLFGALYYDRQ
jgi:hypothetical protein